MWFSIAIFVELIILGLLSSRLIQLSFLILFRITHSRTIAITTLTIVLFPGTVIHELSHLFTAEIMGVHTGKLTLAPESIEDDQIQSGSVAIQQTDPFRRTLIGIAPILNGIVSIVVLSYYLFSIQTYPLLTAFLLYLLLTISSTMFSSKEDLKGVLPVGITLFLVFGAVYFSGIRIILPPHIQQLIVASSTSLAQNLGIVVIMHLVGIVLTTGFLLLFQKTIMIHNSFFPIKDRVYFLKNGRTYQEYRYTERINSWSGKLTKQTISIQTDTHVVQKFLRSLTLPNEQDAWDHAPKTIQQALLFSYFYHEHQKNKKVANVEIDTWIDIPYFANLLSEGKKKRSLFMIHGNHKKNLRLGHIHLTYDILEGKEVYCVHWDIGASCFSPSFLVHLLLDDMSS